MIDAATELTRVQGLLDDLYYRITKAALLRTQLLCARQGCLDLDWRTALLATAIEPIPDISDHHQDLRLRAAHEVANLPNADWELDMKVGWRTSLEAWYTAVKQCIDDTEQCHRRIQLEAGLPLEDLAMDRDLETASYRAGLTAAGLVSNWYEWLHNRVRQWPEGPRRDTQLAVMHEPDYQAHLQQLPRYWA